MRVFFIYQGKGLLNLISYPTYSQNIFVLMAANIEEAMLFQEWAPLGYDLFHRARNSGERSIKLHYETDLMCLPNVKN